MTLKQVIEHQKKRRSAMVAFNVQNILHLEIVRSVAHSVQRPVIAQFSARYIPYWEKRIGVRNLIDQYQREGVFLYLDHAEDPELVEHCIDYGMAGVLYDGSSHSVERNAATCKRLYEKIQKRGLETVLEVELGAIPGLEDGHTTSPKQKYYSKEELQYFIAKANFDLIGLAVGNMHGRYESLENVKPSLISEAISLSPDLNVVLHGGSGLPEHIIRACIGFGVVKVNISTDLKVITQEALRAYVDDHTEYNETEWTMHARERISPFLEQIVSKYSAPGET